MYNQYNPYQYYNYSNPNGDNPNNMFNGTYPCPYFYNQPMFGPDLYRQYDEDYYVSTFDEMGDEPIELRDYGPEPYVVNLEEATKQNTNYRTALWTGKHLQLTLMSIRVGGDIGVEVHPVIDQFIRIEEGQGIAQMGPTRNNLNFQRNVSDGDAIFVPAGTWHNVVNTGNIPLKVYSIYAPPQHPRGTVHATKEIAHAGSEGD